MFLTDGFNIRIPRGDSADIRITFLDTDGVTPYLFSAEQYAQLRVFPVKGAEAVITKNVVAAEQDNDGSVVIHLSPEDTDIPVNVYFYTIRLKDVSGCDTFLGFPKDAFFAVGMDCPTMTPFTADGAVSVTVDRAAPASSETDTTPHYRTMPFTAELTGLFEPDSLDFTNALWRNKIAGGADMTLTGGRGDDNALLLPPNEYGYVSTSFPFTYYLVVKKPVLDNNRCLFGSSDSSNDKPAIVCWNNGDSHGSMFECTCCSRPLYVYTDELLKYHVLSCTVAENKNNESRDREYSASIHWMCDNEYIGCDSFVNDISGNRAFTRFNGATALNAKCRGDAGQTPTFDYACLNNSYYRAFAFGGRQTLEQMRENHRYLYEKYCT